MTNADDRITVTDPATGREFIVDFTTGTFQPASPQFSPTADSAPDASATPGGSLSSGAGPDATIDTTTTDPGASSTPTPAPDTTPAPASTDPASPGGALSLPADAFNPAPPPVQTDPATPTGTASDTPTSVAQAPAASVSDAGTWVQIRTGGTDDDPQLESAVITADHENAGDAGWAYLYVFPRLGAAYPAVAAEGDAVDEYRKS